MKRSLSLWGPVLAWCGLIFFLSSIPHLHSGFEYDYLYRKLAHVTEYAVLAVLLWRALKGTAPLAPAALFALTLGLSAAYAATDEWHQSFVPGRGPSARDVAIDALGALGACLFLKRRETA